MTAATWLSIVIGVSCLLLLVAQVIGNIVLGAWLVVAITVVGMLCATRAEIYPLVFGFLAWGMYMIYTGDLAGFLAVYYGVVSIIDRIKAIEY